MFYDQADQANIYLISYPFEDLPMHLLKDIKTNNSTRKCKKCCSQSADNWNTSSWYFKLFVCTLLLLW